MSDQPWPAWSLKFFERQIALNLTRLRAVSDDLVDGTTQDHSTCADVSAFQRISLQERVYGASAYASQSDAGVSDIEKFGHGSAVLLQLWTALYTRIYHRASTPRRDHYFTTEPCRQQLNIATLQRLVDALTSLAWLHY